MNLIKRTIKKHLLLILFLSFVFVVAILPKKAGKASDDKEAIRIENPRQVGEDKNILKVSVDQAYTSLNPFYEASKEPSLVTKLLHRSLMKNGRDGRLESDLIESYWLKNDGKDLHILLKKGQKFNDGSVISSQDIINNIKLLSDPSYNGVKSYYVEGIKGYFQYKKRGDQEALKIIQENDYYMVVQFSNASKDNLDLLTMPIVPIADEEMEYGDLSRISQKKILSGAGNYEVTDRDDPWILLKRASDDKDIIEKIFIGFHPYYEARMLYQRGSIDIIYKYQEDQVSRDDFKENEKDFTYFIANQAPNYIKLAFNLRDGFFAEDNMRLALKNSIDFSKVLNLKEDEKISSPIYKNMAYYEDPSQDNDLSLKDLASKLEDKNVSLAIYENLSDIIEREEDLVKAFKDQGLNLKISHIDDDEYYQVISETNPYDMLIRQDQLFTIPTIENQEIYNVWGDVSDMDLNDTYNFRVLEMIQGIFGYDNYEFALEKWQNWYHKRLPYMAIKGQSQISVINTRIEGLYINEFVGLENEDNLRLINNLLK